MQIVLTLLTYYPYLNLPYQLAGWMGWLLLAVVIVWGIRQTWEKTNGAKRSPWRLALLVGLGLGVPITALFIGIRLTSVNILPVPGIPVESGTPIIMLFSMLPWMLAAGLIGPAAAVFLAILAGIFLSLWGTHSPFTILEMAGLALVFSFLIRQRYRTRFYSMLRSPLVAAFFLSLVYAPVYMLTTFLTTPGSVAVQLDYALTQTWVIMLTRAVELITAGLFAEAVFRARIPMWGRNEPLRPSPSETSLQARFANTAIPLILALILTLMVSDWVVAGAAARNMISERLSSTTRVAAESLPYFLETGQNLIINIAGEGLDEQSEIELQGTLANHLRQVPYFRQLYVFDRYGNPVTGYPVLREDQLHLTKEEEAGIKLALKGVLIQTYTIPPWPGESTAQISFIATVRDDAGNATGVLLGRTDLATNPFTQPAIEALGTLGDIGGEGMILDENHNILYHAEADMIMTPYTGEIPESDSKFFSGTSPTGLRRLVYFHRIFGRPWAVVLSVPAEMAQELSLKIAVPLLVVLLATAMFISVVVRWGLQSVVTSMRRLADQADVISQGQLDQPLPGDMGVDEVGRLGTAFEEMRVGLKARLAELNHLFQVSNEVAANLEVGEALMPVLQAAQINGIASVRAVLVPEVSFDDIHASLVAFGAGSSNGAYSYLDRQLFDLMRNHESLSVPNTSRVRRLNFPSHARVPGALIAWSLHHENGYNGVFWLAWDETHDITSAEKRYLTTLAGLAGLAASNSRLYATSEIGRQRLESVLASTPEPVLVVDEHMCLLLLNPAALQVPGLIASPEPGRTVQEVIMHDELLDLVMEPVEKGILSHEVQLANDRIYQAMVSPVMAEERCVGRILILQDITHFKQLDRLKTEFVSTVSHDLRSPLTLMKGYATMLQMVGELNEQQKVYVSKIMGGVDSMSRLVNNLLDLGRIDAGIGLKIERVQVGQVIDRVVQLLTPQANQKNIQIVREYPTAGEGGQLEVEADPALLEQALYNLVENAIKYTPMAGKIFVGLRIGSGSVVLYVRDTGIGIAPLDMPHVFEKFYRSGRREAYRQRGTGLGLAIVKSIAERHKGQAWVESSLGKGSTFHFSIPYNQTEAGG